MAADDGEGTTRVPSVLELVGLIMCATPFVVSAASASWSTVNGNVTEFGYSDPVAIIGGMIGALCGVVSIVIAKTEVSQRNLRSLICIALLCVGGYHVARGVGVGVDQAAITGNAR
jgi:uncharacterized membrane protein YfcA